MHRTVRTCNDLVTNLCVQFGPLYCVGCTSCTTVLQEVRGLDSDLDGRLGFGFDLPLLLLPSSPSPSRNCSHSGGLVHFRHSTNRTSWFCGSLCYDRAL